MDTMERLTKVLGHRFTSKFTYSAAGCWIWRAAIAQMGGQGGYGTFQLDRKKWSAHRLAYEAVHGPIPAGLVVDHACHVRACVRPDHLRAVTNKQNGENQTGAHRRNLSSGIRGVTWNRKCSKWQVSAGHNGRKIHGGLFADLASAEIAAINLRLSLYSHSDADSVRLAELTGADR